MNVSGKSKKERRKRLSLVGGKNWSSDVMRTFVGPNGNMKRLKISKKSMNGCKVTGKTAVPRKLRTAIKKRSCESPSPTSTDLNKPSSSTLEDRPLKHDGVKKLKKDAALNWSPRKSPCGSMTKDEEEVAEILFALASMFRGKEANHDARCRHYFARINKSVLSEAMECSTPDLEGSRMELDLGAHSMIHEVVSTSVNEGKHGEETKEVMASDESVIHRTDVRAKHISEESDEHKELLTRRRGEMSNSQMLISCSVGYNSESCGFGPQKPKELMPALSWGTPECTDGLASCSGSKLQCPSIFKGLASEDSLAWSFGVPMISNESSNPQQTSTSKVPAWMDLTVRYRKPSSKGANHSKVRETYQSDRISWKRCATHVRIGYLIQELKGGGNKDNSLMSQMHMKQEMNTDRELQMQASLNRLKTCSSHVVSLANLIEAKHKPTRNEVGNGFPFLETLEEKPRQSLHSVVYKPEKQVFDFLSLSSGDGGVDANTLKDITRADKRSGMWSCLSLGPSYNASGSYHGIPTQNNYFSPTYGNQTLAAGLQQVVQQLPTHLGSSGSNQPPKDPCISAKEQQQTLWAAVAYPQGLGAAKFDHSTGTECSLPVVPSPDLRFPKYTTMVPQHHRCPHQLLASPPRASLPQDHCLPTGVQLYTGALPLQLLGNNHLQRENCSRTQ